jgi:dTDP-4-dehydrorhamnose reductase
VSPQRRIALVVGAHGQLGRVLAPRFAAEWNVRPCTRADVDLTDHRVLAALVRASGAALVVNCAAYNDVDGAEDNPVTALDVNAVAVGTMARAAAAIDAIFVHYSTDFVFDGTATRPYTEDDRPDPRSVYGQSKMLGEWLAADAPRHYVLRVESLFGGPQRRTSTDRIIATVSTGGVAPVFADRTVSASFVDDVADATWYLVTHAAPFGLYHCVNTGVATWLEVGQEIARQLGQPETTLNPTSVREVTFKAPRPQYAALDNRRLTAAGFTMPSWQDALARHLRRLQA